MKSQRFGSLFTGIGGFDLGFERAGMTCAWQVEVDKACQSVLKKQFTGRDLFDDVRTVGKHNLEPVNVICGGFPCQDVSIAGKRAGLAGERSGLWFEFARIIDELEPKWVVIENVAGLLSSNKGRDFAIIIRWLAERGYGVAWRILDSQYFGVAQRRRRVFIVASFGNGRAAEVLFECEGVSGDSQSSEETGKKVARTVAPSLTASNNPSRSPRSSEVTQQVAAVLVANAEKVDALQARDYKGVGNQYVQEGKVILTAEWLQVAYNIQQSDDCRKDRPNGGLYVKETDKSLTLQTGQGKGKTVVWEMNHASEVYRESESEVAPTLQARMGTGGNNVPLVGVRRLTPTECERLQGFPDGWTSGQSDSTRYKQLGNAVTVNVAEWIGKRIQINHF